MTEVYDEFSRAVNDDTVDHHCFGCGNANPCGLRLRFRPLPDGGVWGAFTPAREHEGYLAMTHGGILATVADEAMSWAVTHAGDLGVTARLALTFRQPARIGQRLRVEARITSRRTRTLETAATVRDVETGDVLVEAEARFVRVSKAQAAAWRDAYALQEVDGAFARAAERNAGG